MTVGKEQYLYGTNEFVPVYDVRDTIVPISDVMAVFKHPMAKVQMTDGRKFDYIVSRKISVPVNKENIIKYGILDAKYADIIPDEIVLEISPDKSFLSKPEIFFLDLLSNYQWDRPINMLSMGGDIDVGQKSYLMYEGFSYKFVPIKNRMSSTDIGFADPDDLYRKMTGVFKWDALKRDDYYVDYQNFYTFCGVMSQRGMFINAAEEMIKAGRDDKAVEMLDKCMESVPEYNFPLDMTYLGFSNEYMVLRIISMYYDLGETEKAHSIAGRFADELMVSAEFFMGYYDYASDAFDSVCNYLGNLAAIAEDAGDNELSDSISERLKKMFEL